MAKVTIEFVSKGASTSLKEIQSLERAIRGYSDSVLSLSKALGKSFGDAEKFAQATGLTAKEAAAAVSRINQLNSASASTGEKFQVLARELGLSADQFKRLDQAVDENNRSLALAKQAGIDNANQAKAQVQAAKDLEKAQKQAADAQKEAAKASKANTDGISALASVTGLSVTNAEKLANSLGLTGKSAGDAATRIQQLKAAGFDSAQAFQAVNKELGISRSQFDQLDKVVRLSNESLTAIAAASAGFAAAVAGIAGQGLADFEEYDRNLKKVQAISQASAEDFSALTDEIKRLGIETSATPQTVSALAIQLSQAGFGAKETSAALEGIVRTSEATGSSLEVTGSTISQLIRAFGLSAEESGRVGDILVKTANTTNTTIESLAETFSYAASTARISGQSVEDVALAAGLLGDAGIRGSQAGTNLAQALLRLQVAASASESELADLVRGSRGQVKAFRALGLEATNADGSLKPLRELLPALTGRLRELSKEDQDVIGKVLFGIEGGRAINTLIQTSAERIDLVADGIFNAQGSAEKGGKALLQGFSGNLTLLQGSLGTLSVEIGKTLAEGVTPLVAGATSLVNSFLALPAPIQKIVILTGGLAGVLAAATAAIVAYNLAGGARIVTETRIAAATIQQAIATKAATVAQLGAIGASKALLAAYGPLLTKLALFAGATYAVSEALDSVSGVVKNSDSFAKLSSDLDELNQSLTGTEQKTIEVTGGLKQGVVNFFAEVGREGLADALIKQFQSIDDAIFGAQTAIDELGGEYGFLTSKQLEAQQALFSTEQIQAKTNATLDNGSEILKKYGLEFVDAKDSARLGADGIDEFTAEAEKQIEVLEKNSELLRSQAASLPSGSAASLQLLNQAELLDRQKALLEDRVRKLSAVTGAQDANTKATKLSAEEIEKQSKALKDARDQEKQSTATAREDAGIQAERQRAAEKRANEKQIQKEVKEIQEADQKVLADLQRAQAKDLKDFEATEEVKIQKLIDDRARSRQDAEAVFNESQQQAQKSFNEGQRQAEASFQADLEKRKATANQNLNKLEEEVQRRIQLAEADPSARAELEKQFQDEDKKRTEAAKKRAEIEAQVLAENGGTQALEVSADPQQLSPLEQARAEIEAKFQAEAAAFQVEQQQAEAEFTAQQQAQQQAFEQEQQRIALEFEQGPLKAAKEATEEAIFQKRQQLETDLNAVKEAQEASLAAIREKYADEERARDEAWEDQKRAAERAFNEEERAKDEALAQRIEALKGRGGGSEPRALFTGGKVAAGEPVLVGDNHGKITPYSEVVVPRTNSVVLANSKLKQALAQESLAGLMTVKSGGVQGSAQAGDQALLAEQRKTRKAIENMSQMIRNRQPQATNNIRIEESTNAAKQAFRLAQIGMASLW